MSEKKYWLDDPKNVKKILWGLYISCALLFCIDFIYHRKSILDFEAMYGFYSFYGFGACVILVLLAKQMRKVLARDEDYYEKGEADQ